MSHINSGSGFRLFILAGYIGTVQLSGITSKIIPACSEICQLLLAGGPLKAQRANTTGEITKNNIAWQWRSVVNFCLLQFHLSP